MAAAASRPRPPFIRSRRGLWAGGVLALPLALIAALWMDPATCAAQDNARAQAQPGLVLMAGEADVPACQGKRRG